MITTEILVEFKARMRLEDDEDDNLTRILTASNQALSTICGGRDIEVDEEFKELVFERARYVYNDALEYFDTNFLSRVNSLALTSALESIEGDADATI